MNVNDEKLKKLINYASADCYYCPLSQGGGLNSCNKGNKSCEKFMLEWLQEFDVAEALEQGAHIVDDKIIFPPEEIPYEPNYGVPCETNGRCLKECPYYWDDECPYGWDQAHSCPFNDEACFNYGSTDPCLNCPYAE